MAKAVSAPAPGEPDDIITWGKGDEVSRGAAMNRYSETQDSYQAVYKSHGADYYESYIDIEPNKSVRPGFTQNDYNAFRPAETVPRNQKRIMKMCMDAYDKVGIVRNVIDLMGDFGSQGIQIVHENKAVEDFFQQWFKKVNGKERSERFLNTLYRMGNVIVYRSNANITPKIERYLKSLGKEDVKIEFPDVKKNVIPWRYNFFNPLTMEVRDGKLNMFLGRQSNFELSGNSFFSNYHATDIPETVLNTLPNDIKNLVKNGAKKIPLDPERMHIAYYKKDDWQIWANPMIFSILDDIIMLQKMRLADKAALDGIISSVRLWTLGDFEQQILPTKTGINKLRNILASNPGGGCIDLVWGPELKFTESQSKTWQSLGSEKYTSILNGLYAGLGVPPTLTGLATNGGGFTNNFISLKTLMERLEYGRDQLTRFWEKELEIVRKAMGFRKSPKIMYDHMSLADDGVEKKLLMDLVDRDIISNETLLERFKEIPAVEAVRMEREEKMREAGLLPAKLSPFPDAIAMNDTNQDGTPKQTVRQGNGRPKFKEDQFKRKPRVDTIRTTPGVAEVIVWTQDAYDVISEEANKAYMSINNKSNMRQLTKAQVVELESVKLDILWSFKVGDEVTPSKVQAAVGSCGPTPQKFRAFLKANKISTLDMSFEDYKRTVLGSYAEFVLSAGE